MRNFEERKAEVFRRSEKRIQERKARRNHILMACIPLVLCITIFGAFLFPQLDGLKQAPESSNEQFSGAMGTDTMGGTLTSSVEVSGNGITCYYSAEEDVQEIMSLLNIIITGMEKNHVNFSSDMETSGNSSLNMDKESGYRIKARQSDGSILEYYFVDSRVIDLETYKVFVLSEDLEISLLSALGVS